MSSDETTKAIAAITDARPPATDKFTYLTILESHLSPQILPTLNDILQDAELTQDIGWDLVFNLIGIPGSDACLETIARLGNPREVILKVLEVLELLHRDEGYESDDEADPSDAPSGTEVSATSKFITLLGMLDILHKRIRTKYPSRFLLQTLQTVYRSYQPNQEMTAAIINLVHSLSGRRRPPLPTRKSSIEVSNLALSSDASKNAPDPEAEKDDAEDPTEGDLQQKLLLSFVTCILEAYVNGNDMAWAARLLEFYQPERIVPGKKTLTEAFREDQKLLARDATVGKLVALTRDLGLSESSEKFTRQFSKVEKYTDPLAEAEGVSSPDGIALSMGGSVCLVAYWIFSSAVFEADQPQPLMHIFPNHLTVLGGLLDDDPESRVLGAPGTAQALIAMGLWLESSGQVSASPATSSSKPAPSAEDSTSDFMSYVHSVTLIALYHPAQHVRNAASVLAGAVFHADPADDDRLRILYDLLENCEFAQLRALAITWLREEILAASTPASSGAGANVFATPQALETVQYAVFPSIDSAKELGGVKVLDYMSENLPFLLQAVNFGLFLWSSGKWKHILPANMDFTASERWFRPLLDMVETVSRDGGSGGELAGRDLGPLAFDLEVLRGRMKQLGEAEGFGTSGTASTG